MAAADAEVLSVEELDAADITHDACNRRSWPNRSRISTGCH